MLQHQFAQYAGTDPDQVTVLQRLFDEAELLYMAAVTNCLPGRLQAAGGGVPVHLGAQTRGALHTRHPGHLGSHRVGRLPWKQGRSGCAAACA